MLPPQTAAGLSKLERQDVKQSRPSSNKGSSFEKSNQGSIFKDEFTSQQKKINEIPPQKKLSRKDRKRDSEEFISFGRQKHDNGEYRSQKDAINHNFSLLSKKFQDDFSYLIKYAISSNADKYNLSPHRLKIMQDEAKGKKSVKMLEKEKQLKMQQNFVNRNYNDVFKEQQKVFDQHRLKKKQQLELNEQYEKIDPLVWKTSLSIMKYQVTKDTYKIEDEKRKQVRIHGVEPTAEEIDEKMKQEEIKRKKEERKAEDEKRKKSEAKGISVKIKTEEEIEGFKKIVQKSDEEIAKSVSRLIAIDQRQSEFDDRKLNKYFITIQKKLQEILKSKPTLVSEIEREEIMKELKDGEKENQYINDYIISKHEDFLVEKIIDDLLIEQVFLLEFIEKKNKIPKKQVKKIIINEYKEAFMDYFDDSQRAIANLISDPRKPTIYKTIRLDSVLIETGIGLVISVLDNRKAFKIFSEKQDFRLKNNVYLFNIIARDITEELIEEVIESFDRCTDQVSTHLFQSEFQ